MSIRILPIACAILLLSQAAHAAKAPNVTAPPKLSGTYVLSYTENCQTVISTSPDTGKDGDVGSVNEVDDGKLSGSVGTLTFNPLAHSAVLNSAGFKGSLLILQGIPGPQPIAPNNKSGTMSYSNTSSTLTIGGNSYSAFYGNIVKGLAKYVAFIGSASPGCFTQATAVHQ